MRTPVVLTLAAVTATLYFAREFLIPLGLATLVSFLLAPIVRKLEDFRLPRVFAVVLTLLAASALVVLLGWVVVHQAAGLAAQVPRYRENIQAKLSTLQGPIGSAYQRIGDTLDALQPEAPVREVPVPPLAAISTDPVGLQAMPVTVVPPAASPIPLLISVLVPVLRPIATAAIVLLFALFMLLQRENLRDRFIRLVGHGRLHLTTEAIDDATTRVSRYLLMQLLVNAIYGIAIGIGLLAIGVPNAPLWGLLTTVLRFLPYVGPWLGATMPILLSLAVFDGWWKTLLVLGLFAVVELVCNNFIETMLYSASAGLSPVALLVSALFWTWLWGPVGLVLSTPLTVCLVVIGRHVPQLSFLDVLFGDRPTLDAHARVYQRLLARDTDEAEHVVEEMFAAKGLVGLYDDVLIPALVLAELDRQRDLLDDVRVKFIHEAIAGLVEDVATVGASVPPRKAGKGEDASGRAPGGAAEAGAEKATSLAGLRVAVVPARDVDAIVGLMFVHALERAGAWGEVVSPEAGEGWLGRLALLRPDVVLVSAMPPLATLQARPLLRRIRARFGDARVVAALWGIVGDTGRARERLAGTRTDAIVTSIAGALADVERVRLGDEGRSEVALAPAAPRGSFVVPLAPEPAGVPAGSRCETRTQGFLLSQLQRPGARGPEDLAESRVDEKGRLLVLVGDPAGRGPEAELAGERARAAFRASRPGGPEDILADIALELTRDAPLSALAAVLDPADGTCRIACAGDTGLVCVRGSEVSVLDVPASPPLGAGGERGAPVSLVLVVAETDRLLFFTDGAVEATDERGIALGQRGLARLVSDSLHRRGPPFLAALEEGLSRYAAGPLDDDVVFACLEVERADAGVLPEGRIPASALAAGA